MHSYKKRFSSYETFEEISRARKRLV